MKKIYLFLATVCLSFTALQAQPATEADITAYQSAWTTADSIKTVLTKYDPTLNNLKATVITDYGKFEASKITLLQSVGSTYLLNSYSTSSTQSVVTAATTTLQGVKDLLHEYYYNSTTSYFSPSNNQDGWYRVKIATSAGNYKYLTYSAGNKFLTVTNDETQIWYATRYTNINARIVLSVLSDLRTGTKHTMSGSGAFFELFASGTDAYTMKIAGTGGPVISGIDASTGAISYTGSPVFPANRDFSYRLILERVTNLSTAPSLVDGNYTLQFNGTAVDGTYAVANNLINIGGTNYAITQYGNKYAIGSPAKYFKSAALDSELQYTTSAPDGANAVPYPGFTFTQTPITAYQSAWTTADSIKTVLTGYDPTLNNLKASSTTDYGKFDASKISILQSVGSTYLLNSYSASSSQSAVTAATTTLQSVKDLLHEYYYNPTQSYFAVADNRDGWYRVKVVTSAGNYKYLTYSAGNKFLTVTNDETQIWYATRQTNVNARIALSLLSDLRTGTKRIMSGSGAFFELFASGSFEGNATYTMKSAGTGGPVISGIDAGTGTISYIGSPAFPANRDFSYRLILEKVTDLSTAPSLADANYTLQFNGTAVAGTYTVANNLINIGGTDYAITQYGTKYAIGSPAKYFKSAALDSELEYSSGAANAVPYPGFTFTRAGTTATLANVENKTLVYVADNKIVVSSKNASVAQIFNITGQKISEQYFQEGKAVIRNLNKGIYLVKAGNEIVKVILK